MHTVCGSSLQWILGRWALLYHCFLLFPPPHLWTCIIKQFYVSKLGRRSDSETNEHILSHNCQAILILLIFVYISFVFGCAAFTSHHFYCCHFHRFFFYWHLDLRICYMATPVLTPKQFISSWSFAPLFFLLPALNFFDWRLRVYGEQEVYKGRQQQWAHYFIQTRMEQFVGTDHYK